jgi:hypothetical protein
VQAAASADLLEGDHLIGLDGPVGEFFEAGAAGAVEKLGIVDCSTVRS